MNGNSILANAEARNMHVHCHECKTIFEAAKPWQRFCGGKCRDMFNNRHRKRDKQKAVPARTARRNNKSPSTQHNPTPNIRKGGLRPGTNIFNITAAFCRGESLNRFEAARKYYDFCLNSTVSYLQKYDVRISRKDETIPNFRGGQTHCCRYWVDHDECEKLAALLGWQAHDRQKR